jgi:hypothetical protein
VCALDNYDVVSKDMGRWIAAVEANLSNQGNFTF